MSETNERVDALVTGADGFIGTHLCRAFAARGTSFDAVSRHGAVQGARRTYASLQAAREHAGDCSTLFHLAGLAHEAAGAAVSLLQVNVEETALMFAHARDAGVKRFVWLSSSKVLGEFTEVPWTEDAPTNPQDQYAESKAQAEVELQLLAKRGDTSLAIVRPPLVYGPGVKANFLRLLRMAAKNVPLPLGDAVAPRAWLGVANLVDFLECLGRSEADRTVWHVRDAEESSVAKLVSEIRAAMGQPERMFNVDSRVALALGRVLGMRGTADRIFRPQRMDMTRSMEALAWTPPREQEQMITEAVQWFSAS